MTSPTSSNKHQDDMSASARPSVSSASENDPPSYELLPHVHPTGSPSETPASALLTAKPPSPPPLPNPTSSLIAVLMLATALTLVLSLNLHGLLSYMHPPPPPPPPKFGQFPANPKPHYSESEPFILSSIAEVFLSFGLVYAVFLFCSSVTEKRQIHHIANVASTASATVGAETDLEASDGTDRALTPRPLQPVREMRGGPPLFFAFFAVVIHIIASACSGLAASRVFTFAFVVFWVTFAVDFVVLGAGAFMLRLLDRGVAWIINGKEGKGGSQGYVRVPDDTVEEDAL